jgi:glycosyltransferase involved in cell wall biosynthesis
MPFPSLADYARYRQPDPGARSRADTCRTVSIVTICYNAAETLERTLDSVAAQTYAPIEYVIVDGGSTDGSLDLIRRREPDVARWISEPDNGIADAFNKGIAMTTGDYVAFVNADDWLGRDQIAVAVAALEDSGAAFVHGDLELRGPDGSFLVRGRADWLSVLPRRMSIHHPTVVARRALYERHGLFRTDLRRAIDFDMVLRWANAGESGLYEPSLLGHMSLGGETDRHFAATLVEARRIAIDNGLGPVRGWLDFTLALGGGCVRRWLEPALPVRARLGIRRLVNRQIRPAAP